MESADKEENMSGKSSQENTANESSLSIGDDYEIISEDEDKDIKDNFEKMKHDIENLCKEKLEVTQEKEELAEKLRTRDKDTKDNIEKMKHDLDMLCKEKLKVTQEKEELADKLRTREKTQSQLQKQVDWFLDLYDSFISKKEILPDVPFGLSEETQKRMITIHQGMENTVKDLRKTDDEKEMSGVSDDSENDIEVISPPVEDGEELKAELNFYRAINKMFTAELEEYQTQDLEFPEVPSDVPEHIQNDLQRHKTVIKNILQKQNTTVKVVEDPEPVGEFISTNFINIEFKTDESEEPRVYHKHSQTDVTCTEIEKTLEENEELMRVTSQQKKTIEEKEQKVYQLEAQLRTTTAEKEKALLRISKIAGDKLTEDNPGISDLSDDYRPLKIAEMFNQLYDNEWTDSFSIEVSDMGKSEEVAIQNLLEVLQQISILCQFGVIEQKSRLYKALILMNDGENPEMTGKDPSKQELRKVKEVQKKMATIFLPHLEQSILDNETFRGPFQQKINLELCQPYIRKCFQLCWMMYIQDPAMELVFEFYPGHDIDEKQLKPYKKRGSKVNYLVWPLLLLHHDGPVAQKGIVQPY